MITGDRSKERGTIDLELAGSGAFFHHDFTYTWYRDIWWRATNVLDCEILSVAQRGRWMNGFVVVMSACRL